MRHRICSNEYEDGESFGLKNRLKIRTPWLSGQGGIRSVGISFQNAAITRNRVMERPLDP